MYFAFELSIIIIDEKSQNMKDSIVKLSINYKTNVQMIRFDLFSSGDKGERGDDGRKGFPVCC